MVLVEHILKNAYIGEYIYQDYTLSDIPTTDSNKYINVAKSWYTIQSVTFSFTATTSSSKSWWVQISTNNSNSSRYWLTINHNAGWYSTNTYIRWRINWNSDTYYRTVSNWFNFWSNNTVVYTINRDGTWIVNNNGTLNTYTATWDELNIIQTIMNLSNMNVYAYDKVWAIVWNKVNVTVTYTPNS